VELTCFDLLQCQDLEVKYKSLLSALSKSWEEREDSEPTSWPEMKLDTLAALKGELHEERQRRHELTLKFEAQIAALQAQLAQSSQPSLNPPALTQNLNSATSTSNSTNPITSTVEAQTTASPKKTKSAPLGHSKKRKVPTPDGNLSKVSGGEALADANPTSSAKRRKVSHPSQEAEEAKENTSNSNSNSNSSPSLSPKKPAAAQKRLLRRQDGDSMAEPNESSPTLAITQSTLSGPPLLLPMATPVSKRTRTRATHKGKM